MVVATGWHAAAFERTERLKPLEKYLKKAAQPVRQQTDHEIIGNVFAWLKQAERVADGAGAGS
jgi:hypothetical protein